MASRIERQTGLQCDAVLDCINSLHIVDMYTMLMIIFIVVNSCCYGSTEIY